MQHLSLRQLFITNRHIQMVLNFWDNFIISGMPGQSIKIRDCPGQSGTYGMYVFSPFPNHKISDWSKLKEFADDQKKKMSLNGKISSG